MHKYDKFRMIISNTKNLLRQFVAILCNPYLFQKKLKPMMMRNRNKRLYSVFKPVLFKSDFKRSTPLNESFRWIYNPCVCKKNDDEALLLPKLLRLSFTLVSNSNAGNKILIKNFFKTNFRFRGI